MIHHVTPCLPSPALSVALGADVWLKLENTQPTASFKLRGMGRAAEVAKDDGATGLVTSSGGNAGYAVAYAGRALGLPVTVVVPRRTSERMRNLIAALDATLQIHGEVWDDAHEAATALAQRTGAALIHPFDDPDVWQGHATLTHELAEQLPGPPDHVVVAVGGGGLLSGVVQGLHDVGWTGVPVLAVETEGAASYAAARAAGTPVTLPAITSLALTLGARTVCARSVTWADEHPIGLWQCDDRAAVRAVGRFLDDHRMLVEPSCGAALSAAYDRAPGLSGRVVIVVCGGAAVTRESLLAWEQQTGGGSTD